MYKIGQKYTKQKRRWWPWIIILLFLLLTSFIGYKLIQKQIKPQTTFKQSTGYEGKVSFNYKTKEYNFPTFTIEVPDTWVPLTNQDDSALDTNYAFKSTADKNYQTMLIYLDKTPAKLAVSKVLIVSSQGASLAVEGSVSDNCEGNNATTDRDSTFVTKMQNISYLMHCSVIWKYCWNQLSR
jgi:hypothetical protein